MLVSCFCSVCLFVFLLDDSVLLLLLLWPLLLWHLMADTILLDLSKQLHRSRDAMVIAVLIEWLSLPVAAS